MTRVGRHLQKRRKSETCIDIYDKFIRPPDIKKKQLFYFISFHFFFNKTV